jgi:apolipoprotein N-acyltransferase
MPAIVKNGGPWPLVVLGWFALAAYCAAYFAAYGWLSARYWRWARSSNTQTLQSSNNAYWKRLLGVLLVEPILWCGLELVRSRFMGGFAWNQLGVVPVNSGFGAPAALGGVYLCSAVVVLINGTIAGIAERMWKPERSGFANLKRLGSLETLLAFGAVWGIYSCASLTSGRQTASPVEGKSLKVAMVQRNFPCVFKAQEEKPLAVYERLLGNVAALGPDLVVLPESALCEFGAVDQQGAVRFAEWVSQRTGGAALLAGGTRYEDGKTYNSAALYSTNYTHSRTDCYTMS